ncbi:protein toll-like, partial [Mizuhopecten yessoensis]
MHTRTTVCWTLVLICVELMFAEPADRTAMSYCSFEQKTAGKYPNYYRDVPIIPMVIVLDKTNNSECVINSTEIIQAYNFPENQTVVGYFLFKCQTRLKILFIDTESQQNAFPNVIGYLQVRDCIIDNSMDLFASIVDMRVYIFRERTGFAIDGPPSSYYSINDKTVSLGINDIDVSNGMEARSIFKHKSAYPHLKEVSLSGLELQEFPNNLKNKFPNLESLEMPNNSLTNPPLEFPWNDNTSELPLNLSRSQYLQHQYAISRHLDIPANKYARLFNLNENKIINLTDFRFHGRLHMITMDSNGLRDIGGDCFVFVSDLQYIGMANNQLTSLPALLFKGLYSLRLLDLHNNTISDLQFGLFRDLKNLIHLNLASNQLRSLQVGLFENLTSLRELILDENRLTSCDGSFQPHKSIFLQHLSLNNNPLRDIPIDVFYSRSIKRVDLRNTTITLSSFPALLLKLNPSLFAASIVESSSDSQFNILKRPKEMKEIDLTGSNVRELNPGVNLDHQTAQKLLVILIHYHLNLDKNPLSCDCGIIPLINFVHKYIQNGTLRRSDYYFREWMCVYPQEFGGRRLLEVKEEETYCRVNVSL